MSLIIGLTGSIASGKSMISDKFRELGIPVIDADKLARAVVEPGEKAYTVIVEKFGQEILQPDGTLDRKKLGAVVFADEAKRKILNNIVHPAIRERMIKQRDGYVDAGEHCVVLDIPLLFESGLAHFAEKILVVYVDESVQLERLMERDGSAVEEASQRISTQIPVKEKAAMADAVIDNNGTKEEAREQLEHILKKWDVL